MAFPPFKIISLDGGAASGKSSTSRLLAKRFNLLHVDTGSHFRAFTFYCLRKNLKPEDPGAIKRELEKLSLETEIKGREARLKLPHCPTRGKPLRSPQVNRMVSRYAALPEIRRALKNYQRGLVATARAAGFKGIVMEGRDIGSVIFPRADFKFFLEADAETRNLRRAREGHTDVIDLRDYLDATRKTAPLKCPEGAVRIDNSRISLSEVVEEIGRVIEHARGQ